MQGVLAARIDRLTSEEKALLQQLAVIGRQFPVSLIKHVVSQSEDDLYRILAALQAKEFLYEQPAFPEAEYIFKHALTQDVAYGTMLQEQRKNLHERIAQAIEELYSDRLDEHYTELVHHYQQSKDAEKAVEYLSLAGQQAAQRSAVQEAVAHFTAGLNILQTLPDTPERMQQELQLQIMLGPVVMVSQTWSSPEVVQIYERAHELCQQLGDTSQVFPVLFGLWGVYFARGASHHAQQLAEQFLHMSQRGQDPALEIEAHYMLGGTLISPGEFKPALDQFKQSIALYDPQHHHDLASRYAMYDPGVICRADAAWMLWIMGYPAQARQYLADARQLAQDLGQRPSLAWVFIAAAMFAQHVADAKTTQGQAEEAMGLATEVGIPFWHGWARIYRGWALAQQGQSEEGCTELERGLEMYKARGGLFWSIFLVLWAETLQVSGDTEGALGGIAEGLAFVRDTEERYAEAELYRLKGKLTLQQSRDVEEAETCFLQAIDIARSQQAKSWELRAATSLARLWQGQGKTEEARELLAPVYEWFTEGFDTADLKDAKALLAELS